MDPRDRSGLPTLTPSPGSEDGLEGVTALLKYDIAVIDLREQELAYAKVFKNGGNSEERIKALTDWKNAFEVLTGEAEEVFGTLEG